VANSAPSSFDELVARAVDGFLQSAVVVDDRAFLPETNEPTALQTPTAEALRLAETEQLDLEPVSQ
jgi:hypothetical protein